MRSISMFIKQVMRSVSTRGLVKVQWRYGYVCARESHSLRKHAHAIYRKHFGRKNEVCTGKILIFFFLIFAQNIDCGYTLLAEAVLTSTHNLCFGAKIRKLGIPLHTPVSLYKSGV